MVRADACTEPLGPQKVSLEFDSADVDALLSAYTSKRSMDMNMLPLRKALFLIVFSLSRRLCRSGRCSPPSPRRP